MKNQKLKVLHIVSGDIEKDGGATKGAFLLHKGLLKYGIDSKIIGGGVANSNLQIYSISDSRIARLKRAMNKLLEFLLMLSNKKTDFFSSGLFGNNFLKSDLYKQADIIHLHWINGNFMNISAIKKIKKPIIWTLRDMWPITGGCHYSLDCIKYQKQCGACPQIGSELNIDISTLLQAYKKKAFSKISNIVGISEWMSGIAKKSSIFNGKQIDTIYNCIDLNEFYCVSKESARACLGINTSKKIIAIGATDINSPFKGFNLFVDSLKFLDKDQYLLLIFGKITSESLKNLEIEYINYGYLNSIVLQRMIYSAADIFVAPSRVDAFCKTIIEAMACGTPVVCFNYSGPAEIIDHQVNGYKAVAFDPTDLACGIRWIAFHDEYNAISEEAIKKVKENYSESIVAGKYFEIYKKMVEL